MAASFLRWRKTQIFQNSIELKSSKRTFKKHFAFKKTQPQKSAEIKWERGWNDKIMFLYYKRLSF